MVINPELSTARVVSRLIRFPSAIRVSTFARGRIELLDLKIPHESRLDGMAVCEVNPLLRTDVLLCMVRRDGQTYIPKGDFILRENDNITRYHSAARAERIFREGRFAGQAHFLCDAGRRRQNLVLSCENPAEFRHFSQDYRKQTRALRGTVRNAPCTRPSSTATAPTATCSMRRVWQPVRPSRLLTGMDEENILLCACTPAVIPRARSCSPRSTV